MVPLQLCTAAPGVIVGKHILKEMGEGPFWSKVKHHSLSYFLGEFWMKVPWKEQYSNKGTSHYHLFRDSNPPYTPWMEIIASRVPTILGANTSRWKPSLLIVWAWNTNKIIKDSKGISNTSSHVAMQNGEDSVCKFQSLLRKTLRIHSLGNRNVLCRRSLPTCLSVFAIVELAFKPMRSFLPLHPVVFQQTRFLSSKLLHKWAETTGSHWWGNWGCLSCKRWKLSY